MTWDEYEVVRLDFPFTESVEGDAQLCLALVLLDAPDKRATMLCLKHDQLFSRCCLPSLAVRNTDTPYEVEHHNIRKTSSIRTVPTRGPVVGKEARDGMDMDMT